MGVIPGRVADCPEKNIDAKFVKIKASQSCAAHMDDDG
jgi:hypothetical protein